jgi:predicted nucleic acid-binding protein
VIFLDTNILLYSISTAPEERSKRDRALSITGRDDCALSVQVLQEFYVQATRVSRPDPLPHEIAAGLVSTWLRFRVQENTVAILLGALELTAEHGFSFWDSAILAAARALGCRDLYSEDFQHGREVDGVRIINPFRSESGLPA